MTRAFTFPMVQDVPYDLCRGNQGFTNVSETDVNKRVLEVWFAGCHCGALKLFILGLDNHELTCWICHRRRGR